MQQLNRSSSVGRTGWDAALEALRLFGKGAPYIVIIVGAVFAVYKFQEQSVQHERDRQRNQDAAAEVLRQHVTATNDALVKSYEAMGKISGSQITNLSNTLNLEAEVSKRIQEGFQRQIAARKQFEDEVSKLQEDILRHEGERRKIDGELKNILSTANLTLGTIGTLVDEAPDLLRAIATTDAVKNVLEKSDQLLDQVSSPEFQFPRIQLLLAFADLQGFLGVAGSRDAKTSQEKLARGAIRLIAGIRGNGRATPELDAAEAMAHVMLGAALGAQEKFETSITETQKGIDLYESVLIGNSEHVRAPRWRQRQAEAQLQLGTIVDRYQHDHDKSVASLRKAIDMFQRLLNEEPDDPARLVGSAWAHMTVGEIELNQYNLAVASREYAIAREGMEKLGERAYRSNQWLEQCARVYNGSALQLLEPARLFLGDREAKGGGVSGEAGDRARKEIDQALTFLAKASQFTEELARDRNNLAWQAVHGWSLHNLGEAKLVRSGFAADGRDLDDAIEHLTNALEIRRRIFGSASTHLDWLRDARWTRIVLNDALAFRAQRQQDAAAMRDRFVQNLDIIDLAMTVDKDDPGLHYERARTRASYANALTMLNEKQKAKAIYLEVRQAATDAVAKVTQEDAKRRWRQLIDRVERGLAGLP